MPCSRNVDKPRRFRPSPLHLPRLAVVAAIVCACLSGCRHAGPAPGCPPPIPATATEPPHRFSYVRMLMGVEARLILYAPHEQTAETSARAAFARVAEIEDIASDYRPRSELMRLCAAAGGPPVKISDDLFLLLQRSLELSEASGGAFDVTVGPMVGLWRRARKTGQLPTEAELAEARRLVGWRKIILNDAARTAQLTEPGMRLDLGGIAKGYAADAALAVLRKHGITRALFEMGGDIVVGDAPPDAAGWAIGILGGDGAPDSRLTLANCAISTSGDIEQFVEIDGRRYSHIVDPRTGLGLTTRVLVTVIARDGLTSDSLATAISVIGDEQAARKLAAAYPDTRLFIRTAR